MLIFKKILNKTDLGESGKNGTEILLNSANADYFANKLCAVDIEEPSFILELNKKKEASQKLTGPKLKKFFTKKKAKEGDSILIYILDDSKYYIKIEYSDELIFQKVSNDEFISLSEEKLIKTIITFPFSIDTLINSEECNITINKGQRRKKRKDALFETQYYKISNTKDLSKELICININTGKTTSCDTQEIIYLPEPIVLNIKQILCENLPISNCKPLNLEWHIIESGMHNNYNILFKGVAGTGKSRIIDEITKKKLNLVEPSENILRINIHSASSNTDLMQGIAISADKDGNVIYEEKQGLIFEHIRKACFSPNQCFVLILEEIQENSLNELIGDLIYLIEPKKRAKIDKISKLDEEIFKDGNAYEYQELIEEYIKQGSSKSREQDDVKNYSSDTESLVPDYVQIPYLVDKKTTYRKMIMPNNLYIFCTSNYRDDKKVIEDNLLRRFHVVEVYPQYDNFESSDIGIFLECLNNAILETLAGDEIHEDRFLIGHANWIKIKKNEDDMFFQALLKFFIEFKEIRELEFDIVKNILEVLNKCNKLKGSEENVNWAYTLYSKLFKEIKIHSYKEWVDVLQSVAYKDILDLQNK